MNTQHKVFRFMNPKLLICVWILLAINGKLFAVETALKSPEEQVRSTEIAFARTLAERDFEAFKDFISEEAIFISGKSVSRGKKQVLDVWKNYFEGALPPFSWKPDQVEVLDSGKLALSTGPVLDHNGGLIAYFTSIWRQNGSGKWQIIFDKGYKACD